MGVFVVHRRGWRDPDVPREDGNRDDACGERVHHDVEKGRGVPGARWGARDPRNPARGDRRDMMVKGGNDVSRFRFHVSR